MRVRLLMVVATVSCAAACVQDEPVPEGLSDQQIIVDFADQVVVPTYSLLATRIDDLDDAARALAVAPNSDGLDAAQQAWIEARRPWEQSEGFLFGPVDTFGYDPAMDSWPVNRTDLDLVLASDATFTPEYVANLQETQKGFHTVEYLVFGVDRGKTAADLTARELEYLTALTAELAITAHALAASWTESVDGMPPYRDLLATAGDADNTAYPSLTAAAQEILDGIIGICDEVANGKIAEPYDAHDAALVESQFAFNSIADFQDNLRSVQNAYLGSVPLATTSGRGLSSYVAGLDAALDGRVQSEIDAAIAAIGAIPAPFRDAISSPEAYDEIEAAQAAVRQLQTTFEGEVQPLVLR